MPNPLNVINGKNLVTIKYDFKRKRIVHLDKGQLAFESMID
jgi:hypothetical protein